MAEEAKTIRVKVTPEVARVVSKGTPRELQLMAARGALPLSGQDLVTILFFLCHGADVEVRSQALRTVRELPSTVLAPTVRNTEVHPQLLDFVARQRFADLTIMESLLTNPAVDTPTLVYVAGHAEGAVLSLVAHNDKRLLNSPEIVAALLANPQADRALKFRLGWWDPESQAVAAEEPEVLAAAQAEGEAGTGDLEEVETETFQAADAGGGDDEDRADAVEEEFEELNQSKYQLALEMGIVDKIKIALSGDKEWRSIFLRDSNKLVSSAALKNPRITEGEVLAVAKNKSSSDELIRLITLNKEWTKNYEVKKALVYHTRTPLPKALRYLNYLSGKDLKHLAKCRDVAQVLVNSARRMLTAKEKKNG